MKRRRSVGGMNIEDLYGESLYPIGVSANSHSLLFSSNFLHGVSYVVYMRMATSIDISFNMRINSFKRHVGNGGVNIIELNLLSEKNDARFVCCSQVIVSESKYIPIECNPFDNPRPLTELTSVSRPGESLETILGSGVVRLVGIGCPHSRVYLSLTRSGESDKLIDLLSTGRIKMSSQTMQCDLRAKWNQDRISSDSSFRGIEIFNIDGEDTICADSAVVCTEHLDSILLKQIESWSRRIEEAMIEHGHALL